MTLEFQSSSIVDCNGQKYRIGWDEHGWFTIQIGKMWEDEFVPYDEQYNHSFRGEALTELVAAIKEGPPDDDG